MLKDILQLPYRTSPFSIRTSISSVLSYSKATLSKCKNLNDISFYSTHESVCVLGNGPSLKQDKALLLDIKDQNDFICVNNFCDDEIYTLLKPKIYVFLDPYFFSHKAHPDWIQRRIKTFKTINAKTDWKMKIIVPFNAELDIITEHISNPNVEIIRTNTQVLQTTRYSKLVKILFDTGIYGPPRVNVLIYAIYISIFAKYKLIRIFGSDLSFHNDVKVNSKTNQLFITRKYFNSENTTEILTKNPEKVEEMKMSELLDQSAKTFSAHELLYHYGQDKGIKVINQSSFSLIDAYPRALSL